MRKVNTGAGQYSTSGYLTLGTEYDETQDLLNSSRLCIIREAGRLKAGR